MNGKILASLLFSGTSNIKTLDELEISIKNIEEERRNAEEIKHFFTKNRGYNHGKD